MPETLIKTWHYIYSSWLPNSPYERKKGIDFEAYDKTTGRVKIFVGMA